MDNNINVTLGRIREHIKILNHSSERMATALDSVEDEVGELSVRVASMEANMAWLMKLVWIILGGIIMIVFRIFSSVPL